MDNVQQARRLHESLATAVRTSRQCMREVALGLAEMRARKLYKELGYASLAEYGEQALNFRDGKTGQLATLGDRLKGLPHLDAAMKHGAIGWTTARSIARVATPETEEEWIKRAMVVSSRELEDLIYDARSGDLPPEADDDMGPYRHVWTDIRLDVLDADLLMRAFATMRQEWGDISASQMLMLMLMAERQLYETIRIRGVALAKATKLLWLKRPRLIPILDNEVIGAIDGRRWGGSADPERFAHEACYAMRRFRDLMLLSGVDGEGEAFDNLASLRRIQREAGEAISFHLTSAGIPTPHPSLPITRVLDNLLWFDFSGYDYFGYRWDRQRALVVEE